jgi:glutathione synthase/RimK-type ligase-like ATP-grasp enzyme
MAWIGMLHNRKKPFEVKRAYACAAVAKMEGIDFFYFSYRDIDFECEKINGWIYQDGSWQEKQLNFPTVIINISSPKTSFQKTIYKQLKEKIPFTSHPVGNKMKVFKKIRDKSVFTSYLIPTYPLSKKVDLFSLLDQNQRIVIKPYKGHHGKKVLFVERMEVGKFKITNGLKVETYNLDQFNLFIEELEKEQKYLVQPFIECRSKIGLSYDFRLHVQKNGFGKWEINLIYPRISGNHKLISNVSSGGYRGELVSFLQEQFGHEYFNMKRLLEQFALSFASHFEGLYEHSFDELGIDVGIDQEHKLWIYEVNWRPGAKHREFEVAKNLVKYAEYLAEKRV